MIIKVKPAPVHIGSLYIEGLLQLPSDPGKPSFLVGFPQICQQFLIPQNHASRDFKALLGKDCKISKCRYESVRGNNFNALSLSDYELLVTRLDRVKDNQKAKDFRDLLFGLSLYQLFCDGFGIQFEAEERQQWLAERMESKALFWDLTQAIKDHYIPTASEDGAKWVYINTMNAINQGLFGKTAKQIREELGVRPGELNRDHFNRKALRWLTTVQELAANRVEEGMSPVGAVKASISTLKYKTPIRYS